ncbi:Spindle assembly checkpoint component mad1 [Sphaceloma murrayae]|uniref:Spindle assembly checkpoint component mad1 n=1 Tax=Sphaceloma murrayae TaxID=2082308 RepID=A0A2K1QK57_9PEZI|nr:Spindle assembly checkpoint component mad1 [Sphaceloma murrayae]
MFLSRRCHLPPLLRSSSTRHLSTTAPRPAIPLLMLSALSNAREAQHFSKHSGLGITNHSPAIEAIKSSEVDPFLPKNPAPPPRKNPASASASASASTSTSTSSSFPPISPLPFSASSPAPYPPSPSTASSSPVPGPKESALRTSLAAALLASDPRVLNPATHTDAVSLNRAASAVLSSVAGSEKALSAGAREKLRAAIEEDRSGAAARAVVETGPEVGERSGGLVERSVESEAEGKGATGGRAGGEGGGKDRGRDSGALALMGLVLALGGTNWYAYELLGEERQERERLVGRVQRLEVSVKEGDGRREARREWLQEQKRKRTERRAARENGETSVAARRSVNVVSDERPGEKVRGWIGSLFWAS